MTKSAAEDSAAQATDQQRRRVLRWLLGGVGGLNLFGATEGADAATLATEVAGEPVARTARDIADPMVASRSAGKRGSSAYPAWRAGKAVGQVYAIPKTDSMGDPAYKTFSRQLQDELVTAWTGHVLDEPSSRWLIVTGGGHGQACGTGYHNPIVSMNFRADQPVWQFIDRGSNLSDTTVNRRYKDGRPAARHTYDRGVYIGPGKMADGKERVAMFTGYAGFVQSSARWFIDNCRTYDDGTGFWAGGPEVEMYRLNASDWFAHNTYNGAVHGWELPSFTANAPAWHAHYPYPTTPMQDPVTHDIYYAMASASNHELWKWRASTNSWVGPLVLQSKVRSFRAGFSSPGLYDRIRNRLVIVWAGTTNGENTSDRVIFVSLANNTVSGFDLPQQNLNWGSVRLVHDLDNDRYVFMRHDPRAGQSAIDRAYYYKLWALNPTTGEQTALTSNIAQEHRGASFHVAYLPDLQCVVFQANRFSAPVRFMPTA